MDNNEDCEFVLKCVQCGVCISTEDILCEKCQIEYVQLKRGE